MSFFVFSSVVCLRKPEYYKEKIAVYHNWKIQAFTAVQTEITSTGLATE